MRMRGFRGVVAGVVVAVAVAIGLSSCSLLVHFPKPSTAYEKKPVVGQCWTGAYESVIGDPMWVHGDPVPCTKPHQLVTFSVRPLENDHPGGLFDSTGSVKKDIEGDAFDACYEAEDDAFPKEEDDLLVQRLTVEEYVPPVKLWNAGARWVRCDLSVLAIGSRVKAPRFAELPASLNDLKHEITSDLAQFDFCVNTPDATRESDPTSSQATYADCAADPQWKLADLLLIPDQPNNRYPGQAAMAKVYDHECKARRSDAQYITFPRYPSKTEWTKYDDTLIDCWVGRL